jgi:hypothetical protein
MLGETNQSSRYSLAYVRVKEQTETDRAIVMVCFSSSDEMALSAFLCRTKSSWMCCVAIKLGIWTSQPGPSLHLRNRICHFNASRLCTQYQAPEGLHLVCRRQLNVRFRLVQIACRGYIKG